ncbi:MAG: ATP-binding protein [Terracidiphilus sp.]
MRLNELVDLRLGQCAHFGDRGKKGARLGKGTGMELAIAHAIMLVHGGGIAVESHPEHGSIFRFWVPLEEKQAAEAPR